MFANAIRLARGVGDEHAVLRAETGRGRLSHMLGAASAEDLRAIAERAIATFDDDADLADAWQLMGIAHQLLSRLLTEAGIPHEHRNESGNHVVAPWLVPAGSEYGLSITSGGHAPHRS